MLLGEHEHSIDDKNRLTLPARFRAAFAGGLVITKGLEGCLNAYPSADWEQLVETWLADLGPFSKEARRVQRFFFGGATEGELDKQGRVMIPAALIQHGGLGRNVVIAGMRDHLEIWDAKTWRTEMKEVEGSAEDVAERLATKHD
ncbi:MAG: division/cell wall cluster transcriptional repressor MraZ [Actinomycetota bacterium]